DSPIVGPDWGLLAGMGPRATVFAGVAEALFAGADAVIDFSTPALTIPSAGRAARHGTAYIVGTSGIGPDDIAALRDAGRQTVVVQGYNMSLGVNLVAALVRQVAATLGPDFDIEIMEMHHRMKVDAPSGTAVLFGEAAAAGREVALGEVRDSGRDGITGKRVPGHIGFAALRGGNVVGEHTVLFAGEDERIELTHRAGNRDIFARGALRACLWAAGQSPGFYTMADVLGLDPR
ncbi:MAG: 4-hydroxy-tetrahydrodipicolinate reductase, partial [Marinovum algicola]|uniref:4-hydroxy-tetrahydrodipicolinate reductase n=1 Tax=Marinovum algicola TaxID=42444 RepID=UPI0032EE9377